MPHQLLALCWAVVVVMYIGGDAAAEKFICESKRGLSPYPVQATSEYDLDRYGQNERENFKRFGTYFSFFDWTDDDNGDGQLDLFAVHWTAQCSP